MDANTPLTSQVMEKLIIRRLHRLRRFRFKGDPHHRVKDADATTAAYKPLKLSPTLNRNLRNLCNLRIFNFSFPWAGPAVCSRPFVACRAGGLAKADPFSVSI